MSSSTSPPWLAYTRLGRYDRQADGMADVTGRSAAGVADWVRKNPDLFTR